jgi:hypothetical protein
MVRHMSFARALTSNELWMAQIFSAKAVAEGGVVRRKIVDVERKVGRRALELEVRRRGFHMFECGGQFVIVCSRAAFKVIC